MFRRFAGRMCAPFPHLRGSARMTATATQFGIADNSIAYMYKRIVERLDLDRLSRVGLLAARQEAMAAIQGLIEAGLSPAAVQERQRVALDIVEELLSLGPLQRLIKDPT